MPADILRCTRCGHTTASHFPYDYHHGQRISTGFGPCYAATSRRHQTTCTCPGFQPTAELSSLLPPYSSQLPLPLGER
ncbi:MAG: hypothetical protein HS107_15255 [Thermoflexaceae bacterium]|nr:hypothetical protein [Thermoflexaceae bacterium]